MSTDPYTMYIEMPDGSQVGVRLNNESMYTYERMTQKRASDLVTINPVTNQPGIRMLGFEETRDLLHVGMESHRKMSRSKPTPYTLADAKRVMDDAGYGAVMPVVMSLVSASMGGSRSAQADEGIVPEEEGIQEVGQDDPPVSSGSD